MVISIYLLIVFLGISALSDIYLRKISNKWILMMAIIGLLIPLIVGDRSYIINAYLGGLLAFVIFLLPYFMGVLGAADVKAFANTGLFLGLNNIFTVGINIAIFGGFLALIYFINELILSIVNKRTMTLSKLSGVEIPYAVAIFGGFICTLLLERNI